LERSRVAEEQRSRGAEEQRSRGAEGQRKALGSLMYLLVCSSAPPRLCPSSLRPTLLGLSPSPLTSPLFVTRFVTWPLTRFGSGWWLAQAVSFNRRVYGYLRGPETLARALPMSEA